VKNLQEEQLKTEIKQFARELGCPINSDCIQVARNGAYFRLAFIWPRGQPGQLSPKGKKPHAFTFLIHWHPIAGKIRPLSCVFPVLPESLYLSEENVV